MPTQLREGRQAVDRQFGTLEGVKFVPSEISGEKEFPYKDLKKLENAPLYAHELVDDTEQDALISESQYDFKLETKPFQVSCSEGRKQTNVPEPSLLVTSKTLRGLEKICEQLKGEPEGLIVSVQTKKVFRKKMRTSTVSSVPRENYNFKQHALNQWNHFVRNTVQYTTKSALVEFVHDLHILTSGTHGCIVEKDYSLDVEKFVIVKHLGSGSFGRVDLAIDSSSGKELVRKQIEKGQLQNGEIIIPLHLNSPHVTKVIGLLQRETEEGLKMELFIEYAGRALNSYLIQDERTLTPEQIWILTKQALEGLAHIHNHSMIHLDIKPENLCIKEGNNSLELKITDFGSAKLPYDDITFNGWTLEYMAPECSQYFLQMMHGVTFGLRQEDITGKVDVFALFLVIGFMYGKKHVLLSLITHGRGNYHGMTAEQKKGLQTELIVMMATNGADVEALINDSCDLDMRELLKKMSKPMKDRVTAREALDIVEKRGMCQQKLQRDISLNLQQLQKQLQCQKRQKVHNPVPNFDKIGLPVTVMPEISCERSVVKDKLRELLSPYKKIQKLAEVPKTPLTPFEEMQKLQNKVSTSRTMQEQGHQKPRSHTFTEKQSFLIITETRKTQNMAPSPRAVPPSPQTIVASAVDTSQMPAPALLGIPTTTETRMEYDGFIDLKTQKPEKDELQGNIPKTVFDF